MTNLYTETMNLVNELGIPKYVKIYGKGITWERYVELAKKTNYDSGYGLHEIEGSLMLMWDNAIAVRAVYDGSEWFQIIDISIPTEDVSDRIHKLSCAWYEDDCNEGFESKYPIGGE